MPWKEGTMNSVLSAGWVRRLQRFSHDDLCTRGIIFLRGEEESQVSHKMELWPTMYTSVCMVGAETKLKASPDGRVWTAVLNPITLPAHCSGPHEKLQFSDTFFLFFEHFYVIIAFFSLFFPFPLLFLFFKGEGLREERLLLKERLFSFPTGTQVPELLHVPLIKNTIKYLCSGWSICSDGFPAGWLHSCLITHFIFLTSSVSPGINWFKIETAEGVNISYSFSSAGIGNAALIYLQVHLFSGGFGDQSAHKEVSPGWFGCCFWMYMAGGCSAHQFPPLTLFMCISWRANWFHAEISSFPFWP